MRGVGKMELLKGLLQIKKIIALLLTIVFAILSLRGLISSSEFLTIFSMGIELPDALVNAVDILKKKSESKQE